MERIELHKQGIFINAYGVSAIMLHNMLNYKLIMNKKVYKIGFPNNSLIKVLNTLEDKKISYVIYEEDNSIKVEYDYKISKLFNLKKYKVNKLILDNLDIKNIVRYKDNRYKELYSKMLLLNIIINKIKRQSYESLI